MGTAWVLAGGGAAGAVSAGAISEAAKVETPSMIFANSAGSLNALAYSTIGPEGLTKLWSSIHKMEDVFKSRGWKLFPVLFNQQSFYTNDPLRAILVKETLGKKINIPFAVNCVDLKTGMIIRPRFEVGETVTDGLIDWVLASTAIPALVPPVWGRYVDGGIMENIPLGAAIKYGCDKISMFLNYPLNLDGNVKYKENVRGIKEIAARSLELLMMENYKEDLKFLIDRNCDSKYERVAIRVVAPHHEVIGVLDFDQKKIKMAMGLGAIAWRRSYVTF
jgi:predicted acylesterase/phospholipase RssA